jgi:tRNA (cmo5U34)-methyltransferase
MKMTTGEDQSHWDESTSASYLQYSQSFIPAREQQMQIMVALLEAMPQPGTVLELCCGEGLLAELLLEACPKVSYLGLNGSPLMLEKSGERLSRFEGRVTLAQFELADSSWRQPGKPVHAVVSSLAIHHLDGEGKRLLFKDVYTMLAEGGVFVIADMVDPTAASGRHVAADAWDDAVRQRALAQGNTTAGLDFFLREHWNTYRYPDPDDIDHPSPLFDQLKWLEQAGFTDIDLHFFLAGHALFSGWKLSGHA